MKYMTDTSHATIDKNIKELRGIVSNVSDRVQTLAVAIIQHDMEHGECSRAVPLVNVLKSADQRQNLIQFFAYFGAIGIKVDKGVATGVGHIVSTAKRYNKPSVDGAKQFRWDEPYNADGSKAVWFQGPNRALFISGTLADVGNNILSFAERLTGQLDKTKDNGAGEEVPLFVLTDAERNEVNAAMATLRTLGKAVMARELLADNAREATELQKLVDGGDKIVQLGTELTEAAA